MIPLLVRAAGGCRAARARRRARTNRCITIVDGVFHWGWHGDLDEVPAGFVSELGDLPRRERRGGCSTQWGSELQTAAGIVRRRRREPTRSPRTCRTGPTTARPTGTAPRPARTIADVGGRVGQVAARPRRAGPRGRARLVVLPARDQPADRRDRLPDRRATERCWEWKPATDAFPTPTVRPGRRRSRSSEFADRLGRPPLVLHARHIAPEAPTSIPTPGGSTSRRATARSGVVPRDGSTTPCGGVPRASSRTGCSSTGSACGPCGRRQAGPMAWQRALNEHGRATGVDLLWCMATPADLIAAVELERVIAVRTCDDYRFADDPAMLWTWFLTVNRLVGPLGLRAFKDCFFSNSRRGRRRPTRSTATSMPNSRRCCRRCRLGRSASATASDGRTATS